MGAMIMAACSDSSRPDFYNGTGLLYVEIIPDGPRFAPVQTPDAGLFSLSMTSASGESHTWETFAEFEQGSRYLSGEYTLKAEYGDLSAEGFGSPRYSAETTVNLSEGQRTTVTLRPTMVSTMVSVRRSESFNEHFATLYFHSFNGQYVNFGTEETRRAYLRPGNLYIAADMEGDTAPLTLLLATGINCNSASLSAFIFDYDSDSHTITVSRSVDNGADAEVAEFALTPEMLEGRGPEVTPSEPTMTLPELTPPSAPAVFAVKCPAPVSHVILTVNTPSPALAEIAGEVDLMNLTDVQSRFLAGCGMSVPEFGSEFNVDISPLVSLLTYAQGSLSTSTFTLEVIDCLMRINRPVNINVNTLPVNMSVVETSPVCIGVNVADIIIEAPDADPLSHLSVKMQADDGSEQPLAIESLTPGVTAGTWRVRIIVPDGDSPVTLRLYYDNLLKDTVTLNRVAPAYSIAVDPYAKSVAIKIMPEDESLTEVLTERLTFFINGNAIPTFSRNPVTGIISLIGLEPSTTYTLGTGISDRPSSAPVSFTTEAVRELPNGDFEETKHTIDIKSMLSGGLYSQTFAEIYNKQNTASFDYHTPTQWANTNAKTFNADSRNHNTWYMQPSVITVNEAMSGDLAVELRSVAFDPDGEAIPPYLQESRPFVSYSRNIPDISYRAAGRLFLGSYSFNPITVSETVTEGIPFTSRPRALNGFYRYLPSRNQLGDVGAVSVELRDAAGNVIGGGKASLATATSFTAFNVPISYNAFGVKAATLRVMVTSSDVAIGIESENAAITTYSDPVTASSTGSSLFIDNFTLAY